MDKSKVNKTVPAPKEMGHYQEAPGGGTPLAKGQKAPSKQWVDDNRQMQPRDENGQFTYNAANFKDRKYDYHGKADSDMPWLKGHQNFAVKTGDTIVFSDKTYKALSEMTLQELSDKYKSHNIFADNAEEVNKALATKKGKKATIAKKAIEEGKEGVAVAGEKGKPATEFVDISELSKMAASHYPGVKGKKWEKGFEKVEGSDFIKPDSSEEVMPEAPKTTAPEAPKTPSFSESKASPITSEKDDFNLEEFKKNPKEYLLQNHKKQVKHLMDTYNLSATAIGNALNSGQFAKFSDLENYIKAQLEK